MAIPLDKFYEGTLGSPKRIGGDAWELPWTVVRRDRGTVVAQGVGRGRTAKEADDGARRSVRAQKPAKPPADWRA
jgi:hypothetical protein